MTSPPAQSNRSNCEQSLFYLNTTHFCSHFVQCSHLPQAVRGDTHGGKSRLDLNGEKGNPAWPVWMEQGGRTVFNFPCLSRYGLRAGNINHTLHVPSMSCLCVCLVAGGRAHVQLEYVWMCVRFLYVGSLWLNWLEKSHCECKHICFFYQRAHMWSLSRRLRIDS